MTSRTVSYSLLLDTLVASSRPGQIVSLIGLYSVFFRLKYTVDLPPTCYNGNKDLNGTVPSMKNVLHCIDMSWQWEVAIGYYLCWLGWCVNNFYFNAAQRSVGAIRGKTIQNQYWHAEYCSNIFFQVLNTAQARRVLAEIMYKTNIGCMLGNQWPSSR